MTAQVTVRKEEPRRAGVLAPTGVGAGRQGRASDGPEGSQNRPSGTLRGLDAPLGAGLTPHLLQSCRMATDPDTSVLRVSRGQVRVIPTGVGVLTQLQMGAPGQASVVWGRGFLEWRV